MSDFALAIGNVAALIVLMAGLAIAIFLPEGQGFFGLNIGYRVGILISTLWWIGFSIPTFLYLRKRPGPALPESRCFGSHPARILVFGFEETGALFCQLRKYRQTLLFLLCYFIYSDSYSTIASVGILFASDDMCMTVTELIMLPIIILVAAVAGIYFYQGLNQWQCSKLSPKAILIINLVAFLVICLYGCIGFIDSIPVGLNSKGEMYAFAVVHGFHLGAIQSFTRTIFSELIPPGKEAEFFAIYEISDKGSSWIGPLVVGALHAITGNIRFSFIYLALILIVPIVMLVTCIDFEEGSKAIGKDAPGETEKLLHKNVDGPKQRAKPKSKEQELTVSSGDGINN